VFAQTNKTNYLSSHQLLTLCHHRHATLLSTNSPLSKLRDLHLSYYIHSHKATCQELSHPHMIE